MNNKNNKIVEIEVIKIMIDLYKNFVMAFVIAFFGIIGYTFTHYEELLNTTRWYVIELALMFLSFMICMLMALLMRKLNKLEKL